MILFASSRTRTVILAARQQGPPEVTSQLSLSVMLNGQRAAIVCDGIILNGESLAA
ncbi:hypothetical protein ACRALDRAFT_2031483, partial [Sodiomyces alcalophilus JCM 7366]|uniref:uncharacterized protein n=1 Tax=Sodiomyces alcalophilus JCM 7366 TaxID=591952 RepID=UPI0039B499A7